MLAPFCEFCRTNGKLDYGELHALIVGMGLPYLLWLIILWWDRGEIPLLLEDEPWYVAGGMLIRLILIGLLLIGLVLCLR